MPVTDGERESRSVLIKSRVRENKEARAKRHRALEKLIRFPLYGCNLMELTRDEARELDAALHYVLFKHNIRRKAQRMAKQKIKSGNGIKAVLAQGPWDREARMKSLTKRLQEAEKARIEALKAKPRQVRIVKGNK